MAICPNCNQFIYWVIVKGKVFAIPFAYSDINSEKHELLKFNDFEEVRCPKCYGELPIKNIDELIKYLNS